MLTDSAQHPVIRP